MAKTMLINVTHPEESRVAIVDNEILDGFEIETVQHGQIKGNIYQGIVRNVNTSLQAAFVDFGAERDGFLPLDEVNFQVLPARSGKDKGHRIEDHVKSGTQVTIQVVKDGFGNKPPTLSTFISLPGRFLVLTPDSDAGGVSRKIESQEQRERLRKALSELKQPKGAGVIVRTAGIDQTKTALGRDLRYLVRLWENIEAAAKKHKPPTLLYRERDLAIRTIRDYLTSDISEIWVDDEEVHRRADQWFKAVMPTKRKMLKLYTGAAPLFSKYSIEDQIEQIFNRKVNLSSGGAIVIDATEALTAIDVNSGKYRRGSNIEDTAHQINMEAAEEICRQLRLRDLGGIIVIDFIDMRSKRNTRAVEKIVRDNMKGDKARHDITGISKLGLMEISRQRLKPTKTASTFVDCETCRGLGVVRALESAALVALRKLHARVARGNLDSLLVRLPAEVALHLLNHKRDEIQELELRHRCRILIEADRDLQRDDSEMDELRSEAFPVSGKQGRPAKPEKSARPARSRKKTEAAAEPEGKRGRRSTEKARPGPKRKKASSKTQEAAVSEEELLVEQADAAAEEEKEGAAGAKKRRRRRPRGGRGRKGRGKAAGDDDVTPSLDDAADDRPAAVAAAASESSNVEVLVPSSTGDTEPYIPPSMADRAQDAPEGASWWQRFRRALRSDDAESENSEQG